MRAGPAETAVGYIPPHHCPFWIAVEVFCNTGGVGEGAHRANTETSRFHTALRSKGTSTSTSPTHHHQRSKFWPKLILSICMLVVACASAEHSLGDEPVQSWPRQSGSPSSRSRSTSAAPTASVRAGFTSSPRCSTCRCRTSSTRCLPTRCRAGRCRAVAASARRGRRAIRAGKDPLIKRETLELVRAYYKIAKAACASASSRWSRPWERRPAEVLGGRKRRRATQLSCGITPLGKLSLLVTALAVHHPAPLRPLPTATRSSRAASPIAYGASTLRRRSRSVPMDGQRAA